MSRAGHQAARVQVYYYLAPGQLCEQQLIEPPLYPAVPVIPGTTSAPPHGAPGVNRYVLQTSNPTHPCSTAGGFRRIEIEPQIGSACDIVNVWDFRTYSVTAEQPTPRRRL